MENLLKRFKTLSPGKRLLVIAAFVLVVMFLCGQLLPERASTDDPVAFVPTQVPGADGSVEVEPVTDTEVNVGRYADTGDFEADVLANFEFYESTAFSNTDRGGENLLRVLEAVGFSMGEPSRAQDLIVAVGQIPIRPVSVHFGDFFPEPPADGLYDPCFNPWTNMSRVPRSVYALVSYPQGSERPYLAAQRLNWVGFEGYLQPELTESVYQGVFTPTQSSIDPGKPVPQEVALLQLNLTVITDISAPLVDVCVVALDPNTIVWGVTLEYWE